MSSSAATIPPAQELQLHSLITLTEQGIASRVLAKTSGGNLTLFAFDAGQEAARPPAHHRNHRLQRLDHRHVGRQLRWPSHRNVHRTVRIGHRLCRLRPVLE
jgi:hypothetical protein